MFVGKDFLSRKPPPNYVPGVGRGAVPFSTTAERAGTSALRATNRNFLQKRGFHKLNSPPSSDPLNHSKSDRFQDADEEADNIYAAIEKRRQRKRKPVIKPTSDTHSILTASKASSDREKLATISIDDWAQMPEAHDATFSHKRSREEEQRSKMSYLIGTQERQELEKSSLAPPVNDSADLRLRENLQTMIRKQPLNFRGYLELAQLEEAELRTSVARKIAARGCAKIPNNEELWMLNIRLHSQSRSEISGQLSREIAQNAVKSLPSSEKLWLELIGLEVTKAAKLQWVHNALLQPQLVSSEKLWLLAAELEPIVATKVEILDTARQFANSPMIWIELARNMPVKADKLSTLAKARESHPHDEQVWLASVKLDPNLSEPAVAALPREFWLNELRTSDLGMAILPFLRPTREEFAGLKANPANWNYFSICEEVGDLLIDENTSLAKEVVELYPNNASVWQRIVETRSPNELAVFLESTTATPPLNDVPLIVNKLEAGPFRDNWAHKHQCESPELWELNCEKDLSLISEGIRRWPHYAPFYVRQARLMTNPTAAQSVLKEAMAKVADPGPLWLEMSSLETSIVRKRAILTQATTAHPQNSKLWMARIKLEEQQGSLTQYLVNEALNHRPDDPDLWVQKLQISPVNARKKMLGEALKATKMSAIVLEHGAQFFQSLHLVEKAEQWREMARKSQEKSE